MQAKHILWILQSKKKFLLATGLLEKSACGMWGAVVNVKTSG